MAEEATTPDREARIRQAFDAISQGDVEPLLRLFAPDGVLDTEGLGRFEGVGSIRRYLTDWLQAFEEFAIEMEEFEDLGGDLTFVVVKQTGRPTATSFPVTLRFANLCVWVGGEVAQITQGDLDETRPVAERLARERR
jgi:ketosteroid isomerase-like protein